MSRDFWDDSLKALTCCLNAPRRRPFPGGTSETPIASYLLSSFFFPRNSLRQPTEHDHKDDEGRGRFGTGGVLKVSAYGVETPG